jgi:putative ABC transport system permease protein
MTGTFQLAISNLKRRRLRTLVTASGVAIAVAALYCIVSFQRGYQAGLKGELDRLGAHLLVVPKGCPYDAASIALHGASWPCYLKGAYLDMVRKTPNVAVGAPVLMNAVYDSRTGAQHVYCGVEPDIVRLKRTWKIEGSFPASENGLLVGAEAAKTNGWSIGQKVALPGIADKTGTVTGIIGPTQGADDLFVYLRLADAQRIFQRPGQLTHILVRLDDPEKVDGVARELRGCDAGLEMNVVPLAHLFHTIEDLVRSTRVLLGSVAVVALLAAGAGVSNTILMAVAERTREIGVMRSIGASRGDVCRLVWAETVALCVAGAAVGVVVAAAGSRGVEAWLRARLPFAPSGALVQPEAGVALVCLAGAILLGLAAGTLPAWRAARLSPVEAIRAGSAAGGNG